MPKQGVDLAAYCGAKHTQHNHVYLFRRRNGEVNVHYTKTIDHSFFFLFFKQFYLLIFVGRSFVLLSLFIIWVSLCLYLLFLLQAMCPWQHHPPCVDLLISLQAQQNLYGGNKF